MTKSGQVSRRIDQEACEESVACGSNVSSMRISIMAQSIDTLFLFGDEELKVQKGYAQPTEFATG